MTDVVIGVDVGTGSARSGVFDLTGHCLASAVEPIQTWRPAPDFVEQSSEDIWRAVGKAVQASLRDAAVLGENVLGISFAATCSLVVLDSEDRPLAVNEAGDPDRNIIVWMDHRAMAQTDAINAGRHDVLKYVGGKLSPEMETPKLKWLKAHLPETWSRARRFLDLADYLTYRASGSDARSLCTVVCKWTYLGHENRWDTQFLDAIGLEDLVDGAKIGNDIRPMGSFLGGLTPIAAQELGLTTACAIAVGIIDAHAGGLGLLGSVFTEDKSPPTNAIVKDPFETGLALIGGTSNCHMAVSAEPRFIPGIWGPYYGAMAPEMWLTEGGQSAAGSAIDHVIANHANAPTLRDDAAAAGLSIYELLNREIERHQKERELPFSALLTRDVHMLPYFLGNRSPHADPYARATLDGMNLDESIVSQALTYYAALQAVAYGTRDIVQTMNSAGYAIDTLYVTGGGTKNPLWLQEHADATGLTLVLPHEPEAVLLGAAILAAVGAGLYPNVIAAMRGMSQRGRIIRPNPATQEFHSAKFAVFCSMYHEQKRRMEQMRAF